MINWKLTFISFNLWLLTLSMLGQSTEEYTINITFRVKVEKKEFHYELFLNEGIVSTETISSGKLELKLKPKENYTLIISKQGYYSKKYTIDTDLPAIQISEQRKYPTLKVETILFAKKDELSNSIIPNLSGKIEYDYGIGSFQFIPTISDNEILEYIAESEREEKEELLAKKLFGEDTPIVESEYRRLLKKASEQYQSSKFSEALSTYRKAGSIKADDDYVNDKITEILFILDLKKTAEEDYATQIKIADSLFIAKLYKDAIVVYEKSNKILPNSQYPTNQINEIQKILAKQKEHEDNLKLYTRTVFQGDSAFLTHEFYVAASYYRTALNFNIHTEYLKEKLKLINKIGVSSNKNFNKQFRQAILLEADHYFYEGKPQKALDIYSTYKSEGKVEENYVASQLRKLRTLMKLDNQYLAQYDSLITLADDASNNGERLLAIERYRQAIRYTDDKEYAESMISKLQNQINDLEENYNRAIREGDKSFFKKELSSAMQFYQKALSIKEDPYPLQMIARIQALTEVSQDNENSEYLQLIHSGKKAKEAGDYKQAIFFFERAYIIKQEKWVSNEIIALGTLIEETLSESQKKTYRENLEKADKAFAENNLLIAEFHYSAALKINPYSSYIKKRLLEIKRKQQPNNYN